mgnify:FL=1
MKKHLEVVGAVIVREGKVLAAKRGESKYPYVAHKYEFVGGKIEAGESPAQALVREVKEELRADIRVLRPFLTMEHEYPDFTITLHTFLCEFLSGFSNTEHEALEWLPLGSLDAVQWAPADAPAVEKLKAMR